MRQKKSIRKLSRLHTRAFPDFFLTQLGVGFLDALYKGYLNDERSGIIVAEDNGRLAGFIAYSYDYPNFYKGLIKHHLLRFAFCSLGALSDTLHLSKDCLELLRKAIQ